MAPSDFQSAVERFHSNFGNSLVCWEAAQLKRNEKQNRAGGNWKGSVGGGTLVGQDERPESSGDSESLAEFGGAKISHLAVSECEFGKRRVTDEEDVSEMCSAQVTDGVARHVERGDAHARCL